MMKDDTMSSSGSLTSQSAARRSGRTVEIDKKVNASVNKFAHSMVADAKKLDENTERLRHEK
eukprot:4790923-Karenia_brevis.AAC.1